MLFCGLYTEFMFILMANSLYNHPVILYYIKINAIERDLSPLVLTPIVKYVRRRRQNT